MIKVSLRRQGSKYMMQFRGHAGKNGMEACAIVSCLARMMELSGASVTRRKSGLFRCGFREKNLVGACTALFLAELEEKYPKHVQIIRPV